MKAASLASWFGSLPVDQAETIKLEIAVAIDKAIRASKLSRKQVAETLGTSPAWVTKVLRGDVNLTIESMAKLVEAVDYELQIKVVPKTAVAESISVPNVFYVHKYAHPKFGGAYETDLKNVRDQYAFCNDLDYAHAA